MPSASSFLPLKTDVLLILLAVDVRAAHGYAIIRDVEHRTRGEVLLQTGALYRTLKQLLRNGLIRECDPPRDEPAGDERRRYYRTTQLGRAVVEAEIERMASLVRAARSTIASRKPGFA
jgi:DNA-binding PadR family transcriptional regulator